MTWPAGSCVLMLFDTVGDARGCSGLVLPLSSCEVLFELPVLTQQNGRALFAELPLRTLGIQPKPPSPHDEEFCRTFHLVKTH